MTDVPDPRHTTARYRYRLPGTPVATATVDIGHVAVTVELGLAGDLDVTTAAPDAAQPPTVAPVSGGPVLNDKSEDDREAAPVGTRVRDRVAARDDALAAVREVGASVMVGGVGSPRPRITAGAGHRFQQTGRRFRNPDTVEHEGECAIDFTHERVRVRGRARFRLTVSATTDRDRPDARTWLTRHEHERSAIGMVVLVAVPPAPDALAPAR
ncbi:hypothetical protein V5P93_005330 [Actinokineospora auranticolor]|uniref:Uncharacterized protein n=1 Tax=Actinokineospora auranticolor TaxID=155976 RepID=A0A2S6GR44_9PSEU|nr:hypothetical protein [Actinokineospora auranticolor]PPK67643.1 hypothetical protein CLV40_107309 [Actinokineospora auranticolor]